MTRWKQKDAQLIEPSVRWQKLPADVCVKRYGHRKFHVISSRCLPLTTKCQQTPQATWRIRTQEPPTTPTSIILHFFLYKITTELNNVLFLCVPLVSRRSGEISPCLLKTTRFRISTSSEEIDICQIKLFRQKSYYCTTKNITMKNTTQPFKGIQDSNLTMAAEFKAEIPFFTVNQTASILNHFNKTIVPV